MAAIATCDLVIFAGAKIWCVRSLKGAAIAALILTGGFSRGHPSVRLNGGMCGMCGQIARAPGFFDQG